MIEQAGILAAGNGSRLGAGTTIVKPLVPVGGLPLIAHVTRALVGSGIRRIAMVLNSRGKAVEEYCRRSFPQIEWSVAYRDTAHSLETFTVLRDVLLPAPFLLSTVDALAHPEAVRCFTSLAGARREVVVLGVTDWVDDEKPLWVRFDRDGSVTALGEAARGSGWVTAGLYRMMPAVFSFLDGPKGRGFRALREFLHHTLASGGDVAALPVGKVVDVDRPADLLEAERLLAEQRAEDA
jgi:NDP-sugar pyrophosphorylase family protein